MKMDRSRENSSLIVAALTVGLIAPMLTPASLLAQVRTKKPDRGVYESPTLTPVNVESTPTDGRGIAEMVRETKPRPKRSRPLLDVDLEEIVKAGKPVAHPKESVKPTKRAELPKQTRLAEAPAPKLKQVGHQNMVLVQPGSSPTISEGTILSPGDSLLEPPAGLVKTEPTALAAGAERTVDLRTRPEASAFGSQEMTFSSGQPAALWQDGEVHYDQGVAIHDTTCDGCDACGFDSCDSMGCDSMGGSVPWYRSWANSSISMDPNQWFGGVELLLMFRRGDRPPTLVTTGPNNDADTAGEIGQVGTRVLVGGDSILKDVTAGGRLTLGTWIDCSRSRSLVLRAWFAGEETFAFNRNQDQTSVLVRPFLNVSDNQAAAQDTQIIAFPNRATGNISVQASSDVFGGDVSVRQLWYKKYGGTIDLLYGYQFMRVDENLGISSTSTSLDDDFAPLGSVISISDSFDTENEFHGGQLGFASQYREGCWSFRSLAKLGFGSLRRQATLRGSTTTSIDGATAVDPNGLLVRSTNSGKTIDHTFGWIPELDLSIGWHRYPRFDMTLGYHVIAMTDAVQASDAVDAALRVNLSDPPTGQQRPAVSLGYDTFYIQGIHFGMQYVY